MTRPAPGRGSADAMPLPDGIHSVAAQLAALPQSTSEYLEALAFVLSRVADADRQITSDEAARMELVLARHARLDPALAAMVVEIAKHRKRIADAGRAYRESRHLRRHLETFAPPHVLDVLFEVASADGEVIECELAEIFQLAAELGFTGADVAAVQAGSCAD